MLLGFAPARLDERVQEAAQQPSLRVRRHESGYGLRRTGRPLDRLGEGREGGGHVLLLRMFSEPNLRRFLLIVLGLEFERVPDGAAPQGRALRRWYAQDAWSMPEIPINNRDNAGGAWKEPLRRPAEPPPRPRCVAWVLLHLSAADVLRREAPGSRTATDVTAPGAWRRAENPEKSVQRRATGAGARCAACFRRVPA